MYVWRFNSQELLDHIKLKEQSFSGKLNKFLHVKSYLFIFN